MTWEIGILVGLLVIMVALFLTEKLPVDLTAFLGLAVLTVAQSRWKPRAGAHSGHHDCLGWAERIRDQRRRGGSDARSGELGSPGGDITRTASHVPRLRIDRGGHDDTRGHAAQPAYLEATNVRLSRTYLHKLSIGTRVSLLTYTL